MKGMMVGGEGRNKVRGNKKNDRENKRGEMCQMSDEKMKGSSSETSSHHESKTPSNYSTSPTLLTHARTHTQTHTASIHFTDRK